MASAAGKSGALSPSTSGDGAERKVDIVAETKNMVEYLMDELQPNLFTAKKDAIDLFERFYFNPKLKPRLERQDAIVCACILILP